MNLVVVNLHLCHKYVGRKFGTEAQFFDHNNDTLLFLKSAVITKDDINQSLEQVWMDFPFDVLLNIRLI